MLRKIYEAKRDEITGEWKKLELSRNAYRVLVGKSEGKGPLWKLWSRWEDNLKMDLREVGCDAGDWKRPDRS